MESRGQRKGLRASLIHSEGRSGGFKQGSVVTGFLRSGGSLPGGGRLNRKGTASRSRETSEESALLVQVRDDVPTWGPKEERTDEAE